MPVRFFLDLRNSMSESFESVLARYEQLPDVELSASELQALVSYEAEKAALVEGSYGPQSTQWSLVLNNPTDGDLNFLSLLWQRNQGMLLVASCIPYMDRLRTLFPLLSRDLMLAKWSHLHLPHLGRTTHRTLHLHLQIRYNSSGSKSRRARTARSISRLTWWLVSVFVCRNYNGLACTDTTLRRARVWWP